MKAGINSILFFVRFCKIAQIAKIQQQTLKITWLKRNYALCFIIKTHRDRSLYYIKLPDVKIIIKKVLFFMVLRALNNPVFDGIQNLIWVFPYGCVRILQYCWIPSNNIWELALTTLENVLCIELFHEENQFVTEHI